MDEKVSEKVAGKSENSLIQRFITEHPNVTLNDMVEYMENLEAVINCAMPVMWALKGGNEAAHKWENLIHRVMQYKWEKEAHKLLQWSNRTLKAEIDEINKMNNEIDIRRVRGAKTK